MGNEVSISCGNLILRNDLDHNPCYALMNSSEVPILSETIPMSTTLCYRGLTYDRANSQLRTSEPVIHIYRGVAYLAPLYREMLPPPEMHRDLCYHGLRYQA
jgi:hypothetical protein